MSRAAQSQPGMATRLAYGGAAKSKGLRDWHF